MVVRVKVQSEYLRAVARSVGRGCLARMEKVRRDTRELTRDECLLVAEALERLSDHVSSLERSNHPLLRALADEISVALYRESKRYAQVARYGKLVLPKAGGDA